MVFKVGELRAADHFLLPPLPPDGLLEEPVWEAEEA